jgi:hypothetical protein
MSNKCLLSILFIISITNLFEINAEVKSCFQGTVSKDGKTVNVKTVNCSNTDNFGCYRKLQGIFFSYYCVNKSDCLSKETNENNYCCQTDNCNNPFSKLL